MSNQKKQAIAFIDGQNLFHSVKTAFGYNFPNFDVLKLSKAVIESKGWELKQVRFYTGVPAASDNPRWNHFWNAKLANMGRRGVYTYSRPLKYRNQVVGLPNGEATTVLVGQEKGIDVRLAIDVVSLAHRKEYEVAVIFSQDQDLSEAADEVIKIAKNQKRWIKIASAFPSSPTVSNKRGINKTDWISIDRVLYDACIDKNSYQQRK